jgi:threonine dehydrogenase-like Zn-dependent dehydrogenase
MAINRAVTFMGPGKLQIQEREFPKLQDPKGRKIEHAVILKLVTTNICGSDLHIYHGRFAAPQGMQMGHGHTGEVMLSDILPTGYHGCMEALVGAGSTVYIAGAGPVGRCAAASAYLLGASCIIVGDENDYSVGSDALPDPASKHRGHRARGCGRGLGTFHDGSPRKYLIDPHNTTKLAAAAA